MPLRIFSNRNLRWVVTLGGSLVVSCVLILALPSGGAAQIQNHKPPPLTPKRGGEEDPDEGLTVDDEVAAKRAIRAADKEYQDNLSRARDLSVLSDAIVTSFKEKSLLDREDIKKLEKVEKLAKGIRNAAGGSEDGTELAEPPKDLRAAVTMLGDLSKSLKEKVEKTPKHVISAAVIDEANVLLQVVRFVRTLPPQA